MKSGKIALLFILILSITGCVSEVKQAAQIAAPVKSDEAYFIPPNHDHVFWNEREEFIVYILLAWEGRSSKSSPDILRFT